MMFSRRASARAKQGPSTDLMPSIINELDGIFDPGDNFDGTEGSRPTSPRRINQVSNFNLSQNVRKILANASDETINRRFISEENLPRRKLDSRQESKRPSPDKVLYKSNENLDRYTPSIQKMLSNLPDSELVITGTFHHDEKKSKRYSSFFHARRSEGLKRDVNTNNGGSSVQEVAPLECSECNISYVNGVCKATSGGDLSEVSGGFVVARTKSAENCTMTVCDDTAESATCRPLGSYHHTSPSGIASRTPVGRKNMGKYLQVPSESSVTTNSTTSSSEVSRPVSLTSLGSCSSSGSSGPHQPGSAYQASAESLDSDHESRIQGSADSGIAEDSANVSRKEYDVLAEIMDTETKYVDDLHKIIKDYLEPWKSDPDCIFRDRLPLLFNNLEEIHDFNRSFLDQLKEARSDPSSTAKVFINNPGFSIYTSYCTSFPKALNVLTDLMGNGETARYFKDVQVEKNHDLPLGSYLLKPVQRILRYRMLLERLSEICKPDHKPVVELALATMTAVAMHINNMKRKNENAVRIQEIQSLLYGWSGQDLTTLGELIAEGSFRMGGAKGRRHVFLFDKLLLLTKCKQDGSFAYKSHIWCSNLMLLEQVRGEPLSFHVLPFDNPRLQCTLRAKSSHHKREWTGQLKRAIIENYNAAIPNHAQQLLMQLGQDLPEKDEDIELWTPLKQHSTPQYLERRTRVRKSRDFSTTRRAASYDRAFPSLGSWRRKSEPNVVQQYDTKTVPSRISKLKKAKPKESTSTFYTGLSDSETCDATEDERLKSEVEEKVVDKNEEQEINNGSSENLEKVVSDLIMQKEDFNRCINRRNKRSLRESETDPNICSITDNDSMSGKADSLPRSFQLNDQIENTNSLNTSEGSLAETEINMGSNLNIESQLDNNNEHPEHKIYRKSTIRFSLLQRYHAIKDKHKKTIQRQASKIIGARIANPDYEDPQKLFSAQQNLSQSTSSITSSKSGSHDVDFDTPDDLDLTINENEVLTEFDRRLHQKYESPKSSQSLKSEAISCDSNLNISSGSSHWHHQSGEGYYESILEKNLTEQSVERCDSFRTTSTTKFKYSTKEHIEDDSSHLKSEISKTVAHSTVRTGSPLLGRRGVFRPTKAPPPVPQKPPKFTQHTDNNSNTSDVSRKDQTETKVVVNETSTTKTITNAKNTFVGKFSSETRNITSKFSSENLDDNELSEKVMSVEQKGWVKTVVGRFE